jgi:hypothetical protein
MPLGGIPRIAPCFFLGHIFPLFEDGFQESPVLLSGYGETISTNMGKKDFFSSSPPRDEVVALESKKRIKFSA